MPSASPSGSGFDALTIDDSSDLGSPLPHNAHIHMPPNFSAFDTVEQIIGLAVPEIVFQQVEHIHLIAGGDAIEP